MLQHQRCFLPWYPCPSNSLRTRTLGIFFDIIVLAWEKNIVCLFSLSLSIDVSSSESNHHDVFAFTGIKPWVSFMKMVFNVANIGPPKLQLLILISLPGGIGRGNICPFWMQKSPGLKTLRQEWFVILAQIFDDFGVINLIPTEEEILMAQCLFPLYLPSEIITQGRRVPKPS